MVGGPDLSGLALLGGLCLLGKSHFRLLPFRFFGFGHLQQSAGTRQVWGVKGGGETALICGCVQGQTRVELAHV